MEASYDLIAQAIAAYERSDELNPFDSKHDYAMTRTGQARMMVFTQQEREGMMLFNGKANCWTCHVTPMGGMGGGGGGMGGGGPGGGGMGGGGGIGNIMPTEPILFSDYRYANLGIPRNPLNPFYTIQKKFNPLGDMWIDHGLAAVMDGGLTENEDARRHVQDSQST